MPKEAFVILSALTLIRGVVWGQTTAPWPWEVWEVKG